MDWWLLSVPYSCFCHLYENGEIFQHYSTDINLILTFMTPLAYHPCHSVTAKGQDFASTVPYISFFMIWTTAQCPSLPRSTWSTWTRSWLSKPSLNPKSHANSACPYGILWHITFVYRQGWSSLPPLLAFIAKFLHKFACHHIPKSVLECIKWWDSIFQNPSSLCLLVPCTMIDPHVWVDTLTDWSIGVILGQLWAAWMLRPRWKVDCWDIGWAESIALELAVIWLVCNGYMDCNITIHSNNTGMIGAW